MRPDIEALERGDPGVEQRDRRFVIRRTNRADDELFLASWCSGSGLREQPGRQRAGNAASAPISTAAVSRSRRVKSISRI